jgi:hypothetical protein
METLTAQRLDDPGVRLALALALRARVVAAVASSAAAGAVVADEPRRAGAHLQGDPSE